MKVEVNLGTSELVGKKWQYSLKNKDKTGVGGAGGGEGIPYRVLERLRQSDSSRWQG